MSRSNAFVYFVAIMFLVATMVVTLWPRRCLEAFAGSSVRHSSYNLYTSDDTQCTTAFDYAMRQLGPALERRDEFFQFKGCYKFDMGIDALSRMDPLFSQRSENMYVDNVMKSTANFNDVIQEVKMKVETFANAQPDQSILGDVYVIIAQIPHYRDAADKLVVNTVNQASTMDGDDPFASRPYLPYMVRTGSAGTTVGTTVGTTGTIDVGPIMYYVMVIYDRYNASKQYMGDANPASFTYTHLARLSRYASKDPQCFMVGAGTGEGRRMFAGCTSQRDESSCRDKDLKEATYLVMYKLNLSATNVKQHPSDVNQGVNVNCTVYKNNPSLVAVPLECSLSYWKEKGCYNPNFIQPCADPWKSKSYAEIKTRIDGVAARVGEQANRDCYGRLEDGVYKDQVISDAAHKYYYIDSSNTLHELYNVVHPSDVTRKAISVTWPNFYTNAPIGSPMDAADVV